MIYLPLRTRRGRKLLKLLKQRITLSTHSTIKYYIISTMNSRVHQFICPAAHPIPLSIAHPPSLLRQPQINDFVPLNNTMKNK